MAGIAPKGRIGYPLPLLRSKTNALAGVFEILARRHDRHHQWRSLFSTKGLFSNRTSATTLSLSETFSRSAIHGHHASTVPTLPRSIDRRRSHGQSTAEASSRLGETAVQSHERRPKSDPTAKRPTIKCDPYGMSGGSLSRAQCLDWMSTLDEGWTLHPPAENKSDTIHKLLDDNTKDATIAKEERLIFLQKRYYHRTLHEASQYLSHISLLATNLNHFPFLSMERILVDDLNTLPFEGSEDGTSADGSSTAAGDESNDLVNATIKRRRKVKGWAFQSTVRCSTYRPPAAGAAANPRPPSSRNDSAEGESHKDKGLTYHDFHLAMSIDVEASREEVKLLLWSNARD